MTGVGPTKGYGHFIEMMKRSKKPNIDKMSEVLALMKAAEEPL